MQFYRLNINFVSIATAIIIGLAGCSSGGGGSSNEETTLSGVAVDGYLQGANVEVGTQHTITDEKGAFKLAAAPSDGEKIVIFGGIDKSTGYAFEGKLNTLYEEGGSLVVSPLSTYVTALMEQNLSAQEAKAQAAASLGISLEDLQKDPMSSPKTFFAAQKVQKSVEVLATAFGSGAFNDNYEKVMQSLALATKSGTDFTTTALAQQIEGDYGIDIDSSVKEFLEGYSATVDVFAASDVNSDALDSLGEVFNTYTEVVEGALDANKTDAIAAYTAQLTSIDAAATLASIDEGVYEDPLVNALAEVEAALNESVHYLGANSSDENITVNLELTDPTQAPFDRDDLNLSWSSSNSAILSSDGSIVPAYVDAEVELIATVWNRLAINSRVYHLIIKRVEVAPVAQDLDLVIDEDKVADAIDFSAVISDLNGDALTVTAVGDATNGTVTLNDGSVRYQPNANFNGSDTFTYTVTDATGLSAQAVVNVTINPVDDATVWHTASNLGVQLEDFTPFSVELNATDADGDVTYSLISNTAGVSVTLNDSILTISSVENANGTQEIVVGATQGGVLSELNLSLEITPVDDMAVWNTAATLTAVDEDFTSAVTVNLEATDIDSAVVYTLGSSNGVVDASLSGSTLTLVAVPNANGLAEIELFANGVGQIFTMQVNPLNDAPEITAQTFSVKIDTQLSERLIAFDVDGDSLTFSNASVAEGSVTLNSDGTFTYEAGSSSATVELHYDVSDGTLTTSGSASILVVLSDPPNAINDTTSTVEDTAVTLNVIANDSDDVDASSDLQIVAVSTPSSGSAVNNGDGTITYTPNSGFIGDDSFTYTVRDSDGGETVATVVVTVTAANHPPVVEDRVLTLVIGETISGNLGAVDDDGDALSYTLNSASDMSKLANASLSSSGDYTIEAGAIGGVTIVIDVSDGVETTTVTYNVTIIAPEYWEDENSISDGGMLESFDSLSALEMPKDVNISSLYGYEVDALGEVEFDVVTMRLNSDGTLYYSEDNTSNLTYTEDATTHEIHPMNSGVDIVYLKLLAIYSTPSEIQEELNVVMPEGAVVYKTAIKQLYSDYFFWGEAYDYVANSVYNSLQAFVDAGIAAQRESNYRRALIFAQDADIADGSGTLMEADITAIYSGGEPVILNENAGSWSIITDEDINDGNSPILLVTPNDNEAYDVRIYVLDDFGIEGSATNSVWEGTVDYAGTVFLDYSFNDKALAAAKNATKMVTPELYITAQAYTDMTQDEFESFAQVTDPRGMNLSWFGIDYNQSTEAYDVGIGRMEFATTTVTYTETMNGQVVTTRSDVDFTYNEDQNITIDGGSPVFKIGQQMSQADLFDVLGLSFDGASRAYMSAEFDDEPDYNREIFFDDNAMALVKANFDNYENRLRFTYEMIANKSFYVITQNHDALVLSYIDDGSTKTLYRTFGSFTHSYDPYVVNYSIDSDGDILLSDGTRYHIAKVTSDGMQYTIDVTLGDGTNFQSTLYIRENDARSAY